MKLSRIILFIFVLLFGTKVVSQEKATIEKSIFGIDAGLLGLWINNEARLTSHLSLKSELGLQTGGIFVKAVKNDKIRGLGIVLLPVIELEPRYYCSVKKRAVNNKLVNNNGFFVALNLKYQPDLFVISDNNINPLSNISIIPKFCGRWSLGNHFHYEGGLGLRYVHILKKTDAKDDDYDEDLYLRIGYNF